VARLWRGARLTPARCAATRSAATGASKVAGAC